jgi:hypothetical protein
MTGKVIANTFQQLPPFLFKGTSKTADTFGSGHF